MINKTTWKAKCERNAREFKLMIISLAHSVHDSHSLGALRLIFFPHRQRAQCVWLHIFNRINSNEVAASIHSRSLFRLSLSLLSSEWRTIMATGSADATSGRQQKVLPGVAFTRTYANPNQHSRLANRVANELTSEPPQPKPTLEIMHYDSYEWK